MRTNNYTSENICRAIGFDGFANDGVMAEADQAIRILLMPSFHQEVCLTFLHTPIETTISVVAPKSQIWQQDWPAPQETTYEKQDSKISMQQFLELKTAIYLASEQEQDKFLIIGGMVAHSILHSQRELKAEINKNSSATSEYYQFIEKAIQIAWNAIDHPFLRYALGNTGRYVKLAFPEQILPPQKTTIRILVLGEEKETEALLSSLKRHHEKQRSD